LSLESGAVRVERSEQGDLAAVSASGARLRIVGGPGGEADGWQPTELLMAALAGCVALDVATILERQRNRQLTADITVTPGLRDDSLPGRAFQSLRVQQAWTGPMSAEALARAVALAVERYCTVQLTLERAVQVEHSLQLVRTDAASEGTAEGA